MTYSSPAPIARDELCILRMPARVTIIVIKATSRARISRSCAESAACKCNPDASGPLRFLQTSRGGDQTKRPNRFSDPGAIREFLFPNSHDSIFVCKCYFRLAGDLRARCVWHGSRRARPKGRLRPSTPATAPRSSPRGRRESTHSDLILRDRGHQAAVVSKDGVKLKISSRCRSARCS
jgi:hypothetical protein